MRTHSKNPTERYDAIVIGGGHNGLVCAAYLARTRQKVLVLERREQAGGCAITEEIIPGYKVSACAHAVGMFRPEIIEDLALVKLGLDLYSVDPMLFVLYAPEEGYLFWEDLAQTFEADGPWTARDRGEYERLLAIIGHLAALLEPTFLAPPVSEVELRQRFEQAGLAEEYNTVFHVSVDDFLSRFALDERLKMSIAPLGLTMHWGGPHTPGTAYNLFRLSAAQIQGKPGAWGFVRGGMGKLSRALARAAQQLGVEIRTGTEVAEILLSDGRAYAVVIKGSGDILYSNVVISNADPKRTFLHLIDGRHLSGKFRQQIANIKMRGAGMKILCALDGLPEFKAIPGAEAGPQHRAGGILIAPSMEYLARAWADAQNGVPSRQPILELTLQSATDPTLAPPSKHVLSIHVQYTPYHLREGSWEQLGEHYADQVIDQLTAYIPNLKALLLARKVLTPFDLAQTFYLTEGHWEHGEMIAGQMFAARPLPGWADYRTPIAGLYLCGAGAHPGGTVSGAPGYNAARQILEEQP